MELSWDDWRLFLAAWETGSLSAAATRLGLGQATLSRRIAQLERNVGHVLFDRTRQGLAPTEAAFALAPHAEAMSAGSQAAEAALRGLEQEPEGIVRVAVPEGLAVDLMPAILSELRWCHPKIRLEVLADNRYVDLSRREADLAIRGLRPEGGDLLVRRLPDQPIGLFAAPRLLSSLPPGATLAELPLVQWTADLAQIGLARWSHELLGGRPPAYTSNNFLSLRAAAVAGIGAIALPVLQGQLVGLVPVPIAVPPVPPASWYLVVPRPLRLVPRIAAVVELIDRAIRTGIGSGTWPPPDFASVQRSAMADR